MHSSFARALNDVKHGDGSLAKALNSSQSLNINAPSLLLSSNITNRSFSKAQAPRKRYQSSGFENSIMSQAFNRKMKASEGDGDRFIPSRRGTDIERAQFYLAPSTGVSDPSILPKPSDRILKFTHKRPSIADQEPILDKVTKSIQSKRYIPSRPENVLDAPNLLDDFYLSILDWSDNNALAIALDRDVYIWKAGTGEVQHLMTAGLEEEHITSVRFSSLDGNVLAVGTSMGRLQLWDVQSCTLQRTMLTTENDPSRIPTLAWREQTITSGSRTGEIRHHDIRVAQHQVGYANTHSQEVCGLQWSPDNRFLASGGNDNLVCIYSANEAFRLSGVKPAHELSDHTAAVKALAWCPWKPNLLASGGGTRDHHLRFWNVYSGACIRKVDVKTQVSGIIWNEEHRELISSHGNGSLCIWSYPSITKVKELVEHKSRVLAIASSPDKEVIASCGADETLRIWQCFQVDSSKKRLESSRSNGSVLAYSQPIR